ncbi:uncharacterized protein LOC102479403 [Tupaia chinensis]|uniref:uncharacterized protein LOC102479403 n=1 Tax=Tupaia chinensis TaxID=246437 RepID=UPI000FFBA496|nr:uncharacterized protein LOC102479403 [Tupaia chinensis]
MLCPQGSMVPGEAEVSLLEAGSSVCTEAPPGSHLCAAPSKCPTANTDPACLVGEPVGLASAISLNSGHWSQQSHAKGPEEPGRPCPEERGSGHLTDTQQESLSLESPTVRPTHDIRPMATIPLGPFCLGARPQGTELSNVELAGRALKYGFLLQPGRQVEAPALALLRHRAELEVWETQVALDTLVFKRRLQVSWAAPWALMSTPSLSTALPHWWWLHDSLGQAQAAWTDCERGPSTSGGLQLMEGHSAQARPEVTSKPEQLQICGDPELTTANPRPDLSTARDTAVASQDPEEGPEDRAGKLASEAVVSLDSWLYLLYREGRQALLSSPRRAAAGNPSVSCGDWRTRLFCLRLRITAQVLEQSVREEELRAQHQAALLRLREMALEEKTRAELAWLEHQRGCLGSRGDKAALAALAEKRQRALSELEKEQRELRALRSVHLAAHLDRKLSPWQKDPLSSQTCLREGLRQSSSPAVKATRDAGSETSQQQQGRAQDSLCPLATRRPGSSPGHHPPRRPAITQWGQGVSPAGLLWAVGVAAAAPGCAMRLRGQGSPSVVLRAGSLGGAAIHSTLPCSLSTEQQPAAAPLAAPETDSHLQPQGPALREDTPDARGQLLESSSQEPRKQPCAPVLGLPCGSERVEDVRHPRAPAFPVVPMLHSLFPESGGLSEDAEGCSPAAQLRPLEMKELSPEDPRAKPSPPSAEKPRAPAERLTKNFPGWSRRPLCSEDPCGPGGASVGSNSSPEGPELGLDFAGSPVGKPRTTESWQPGEQRSEAWWQEEECGDPVSGLEDARLAASPVPVAPEEETPTAQCQGSPLPRPALPVDLGPETAPGTHVGSPEAQALPHTSVTGTASGLAWPSPREFQKATATLVQLSESSTSLSSWEADDTPDADLGWPGEVSAGHSQEDTGLPLPCGLPQGGLPLGGGSVTCHKPEDSGKSPPVEAAGSGGMEPEQSAPCTPATPSPRLGSELSECSCKVWDEDSEDSLSQPGAGAGPAPGSELDSQGEAHVPLPFLGPGEGLEASGTSNSEIWGSNTGNS